MDTIATKIKKHQKILTTYIQNLAQEYNTSLGSSKNYHAIIDTENNHFQFIQMGWNKKGRFSYGVLLHFTINPETGNIWLQQNNTEIEIDIALRELAAIPKEHIVIGFHPLSVREYSGYAVA